jgi:hypothetical protein
MEFQWIFRSELFQVRLGLVFLSHKHKNNVLLCLYCPTEQKIVGVLGANSFFKFRGGFLGMIWEGLQKTRNPGGVLKIRKSRKSTQHFSFFSRNFDNKKTLN